MRVLFAYDGNHGIYAESLRRALRVLRPGEEVAACGIAELGVVVEGFDPDLVVSSSPNTVEPRGRTAWYRLSPEPDEPSEVCVGGRRRILKNPGVDDLLAVVDETGTLLRSEQELGGC